MGTKYERTKAFNTLNTSVVEKTFEYLYLPKITAHPDLEISNDLNICARSPNRPWLSFNCNFSSKEIVITMDAKD